VPLPTGKFEFHGLTISLRRWRDASGEFNQIALPRDARLGGKVWFLVIRISFYPSIGIWSLKPGV
jgi:hypothetical protein